MKTVSNTIESVEKSNLNEGSVIKSFFFLHEENIKKNKKITIHVLKKILINLSENIIKNLAVKINILILNRPIRASFAKHSCLEVVMRAEQTYKTFAFLFRISINSVIIRYFS